MESKTFELTTFNLNFLKMFLLNKSAFVKTLQKGRQPTQATLSQNVADTFFPYELLKSVIQIKKDFA